MHCFIYSYVFVIHCLNRIGATTDEPIAVTDAPLEFVHKFYIEERNEDPPSESDPTTVDASARLRLCSDINNNTLFDTYEWDPVDKDEIYTELKRPKYAKIFHLIYESTQSPSSQAPPKYVNPYRRRNFDFVILPPSDEPFFALNLLHVEEHVFVCLSKDRTSNEFIIYYVSKAYNVKDSLRFVFPEGGRYRPYTHLMLVEKSAEVYEKADFNVELHYLELRKRHHWTGINALDDPVCKHITAGIESDQSIRLCGTVLSSSYFKKKVKYSQRIISEVCYIREVLFITPEGVKEAQGKSYYELLIRCDANEIDSHKSVLFYISRAYNPNQVFVYSHDLVFKKVYLEVLVTRLSTVHERYHFGNVET